ncbi:MAG TPA: response regulator [Burkholderiales bacterium]|nr:response regulator [Burkholderiales bacterium]
MTEKANILLVDDQPSRLLTYEAILSGLKQNLIKARSGTQALQQLMEREFAAILLDVSMPGMDGFETAAMIHQHPRFENTPIIFVTAVHVTDMDRLKGYQMGAVDYVYVPVIPEILRGKVQVLVELYLQRRELQRLNISLAGANVELTQAHETLRAENTRELQKLNQNLARANGDLEQANKALTLEIAQRERAQQALQAAARRKDEFLAILAHELRNPLSAIHNGVQIMHRQNITEPKIVWARDLLGRQVKHLTRLIDDLLDVSRITTGRIELQREPIDLSVVITRAIETTRPLVEARRHKLMVKLPSEPLCVEGDTVRLIQVMDNLLTNAAKYTNEGGTIVVSVEHNADESSEEPTAVVRVRDDGIGIPQSMLDQIFELFTQANPTFDRTQSGLGIGLALVRGLVSLHGGTVRATSDGPGKGSEFVVHLPLLSASFAVQSADPVTPVRQESSNMRVLVVDDNVDSAQGVVILLEAAGYKVEMAHSGDMGLARAIETRPDAVILDIGLPGLDGYEVAQQLRKHAAFRSVPLIAMTGFSDKSNRRRALQAGFDHYLVKPVDYEALMNVLALLARPAVAET